jgi:tRNA(Met) C34 N-acetyltransferase TmcA
MTHVCQVPSVDSQYREPRSAVICRATTECIRNSGHTDTSFAQAVAESYMQRVAPAERVVQFHVGTDLASIDVAHKRNAKIVERFRDGTVKLPADLEEAWVAAMPQPWRDDCERELARRYGFLGARAPEIVPNAGVLQVAGLALEVGHTLEALAQVMADGKVDASDVPALLRALRESRDLAAELETLQARIQAALEEQGARVVSIGAAR